MVLDQANSHMQNNKVGIPYSIAWRQVAGPSHTQGKQVIQNITMRAALGSVCHNISAFFHIYLNVNSNNLPFANYL